jgi:hypothetical protein
MYFREVNQFKNIHVVKNDQIQNESNDLNVFLPEVIEKSIQILKI